jgi:HK97 family phage portal protein
MTITRTLVGALAKRADPFPTTLSSPANYVGAGWGTNMLQLEDGEANWSASAAAYRAIMATAGGASSLTLQVRNTVDDTVVEGHWLTDLWERPNPNWTRRALGEVVWAKMETKGQAFLWMDRGASGTSKPRNIWPIFGRVTPVVAAVRTEEQNLDPGVVIEEHLLGFQVTLANGKRIGLLPDEVLWLRYPNPNDQWGCLPPLAAAGHAVETDAYARAWQRGEFQHGAKPRHVVYLGDLGPEEFNTAVETWKSQVEGVGNAGKSLLLASKAPANATRITMNAEEMAYLESRKMNWEEVLLALAVPKDYLLGGATYENRAASATTLWADGIVPKLEIVAGEIARQLLATEANRRCRFDTDEVDALQENEDAKAKRATDLHAHDVTTMDEARATMGLDPIGGVIGGLTLTAYRLMIQAQAQIAVLNGQGPADPDRLRQIGGIAAGPALNGTTAPLMLPSGMRAHGPDRTTILKEYARHETAITKATARLAARQQSVTLTNVERLGKGSTKAAQAWQRDVVHAYLAWQALEDRESEEAVAAELVLRAKVDKLFNSAHWRTETVDALAPSVGGAWESGAITLARSLGIDFDKFDQTVASALDDRLEVLAAQVTDTTRQVLESRVILDGLAAGESIDQLKVRIRGVFTDLKSWRATMIARTETVGGFNGGSYTIAKASGVVVEREWGATLDPRTRDSHERIDGTRVKGFEARYANGCLHPGDPTGKPEETVMCRCVEFYWTKD